MIPLRIEGATRRLAEDQEEFKSLSIRDVVISDCPLMLSSWELDADDMRKLRRPVVLGAVLTPFLDGNCGIAMSRVLNGMERAMLHNGGTATLIISGTIHPPVCFQLITVEESVATPVTKTPFSADFSIRPPPHD